VARAHLRARSFLLPFLLSQSLPAPPPPRPRAPQAFGGVEGVLTKFQTSATLGITGTSEDLAARRAQFGENKLPEPAHESWWAIFFDCFKDIILIILLVAAVVALIVGVIEHGAATGWIDGVAILIAVFIVATVTATNDYNKQLQFRKLSKESSNMVEARVVRGGREMMVKTSAVAVGDLVLIDTGDKLPADGFLLRSTDLRINESRCERAVHARIMEGWRPLPAAAARPGVFIIIFARARRHTLLVPIPPRAA
jgi:cation transport ATPase